MTEEKATIQKTAKKAVKATTKKTTKKTVKTATRKTRKNTAQTASRYQTVQALRKTGESLTDRIGYYKARYIEVPVYSSLAFMVDFDDLGAEARERVDTLVQGGRDVVKDLEKDGRLVADRLRVQRKKAFASFSR